MLAEELPEIKIEDTAANSRQELDSSLSLKQQENEAEGLQSEHALHEAILEQIDKEATKVDTDAPSSYAAPNMAAAKVDHEAIYREDLQRKKEEMFKALTDLSTAPATHLSNNPKELKVLEYAENFKEQYGRLFPNRKELLMMPPNEFGIRVSFSLAYQPVINWLEICLYDHQAD